MYTGALKTSAMICKMALLTEPPPVTRILVVLGSAKICPLSAFECTFSTNCSRKTMKFSLKFKPLRALVIQE